MKVITKNADDHMYVKASGSLNTEQFSDPISKNISRNYQC